MDEPLAADAQIAFSLSRPGEEPALASFPLNALDATREELLATDRRHYAVAAQTQDYRFSLRSLTASPSVVFTVIDAEALTDYGRAHLDVVPEFSVFKNAIELSLIHLICEPHSPGRCRVCLGGGWD